MGRTFSSNLILLILLVLSACGGSGEVPVAQQQNNQPRAVSDSYKVDSNTSLPVLSNDSDPDGDSISITAITQPPHGTASINGDVIDLQIDQDFVGVETFTYTISDSKGATATAQVTLELNPANKVPVANNDRVVGQRDAIIDIAVLENDSDENGDALTITEVGSASSGSVSIVNNAIRYIPNAGFIGDDTFTYTVSDGSLIASASVTIVVNDASAAGNQTPITQADNFSVLFETTTNLDVLLNDSDPENDQLSIIEILEPDHGSVAIVTISSNGTNIDGIEYTPHPNYIGVDSLIYIVSDGNTSTAETVHLEVKTQEQNNRPSAKDDSVFTTPGNSVALSPYTNDLDLDGDALSLVTISAPLNGTVSIDENGTPNNFLDDVITYTPDPGFIGTETLVYSLSDGFDEDRAAINFIVASSQANTMQVTGSVHKGAVASSLVSLYESDRNGMPIWSKPVISATSEPDGSWVTAVPTNKTLLIAVAEGGSFIDETEPDSNATSKRLVTLSQLPVLESVWESGQTHVSINAYTSALLRKARFESSSSIFVTLDNNRGFAKDAFGYDPFSTRPTDPIEPDPAASTDAMNYAVFLGGFANALNANATEFNLALPTSELVDAVIEDLSDCVLDAKSFAVPVPFSSSFLNDITDINPEIRRFRNNNFTRFPGPQVEINITACQQDGTSTDFEAPVISLNPATSGDIDFSVLAGDTFVDPGASATDNVDGDLSTSVTTEIRLDANLVSTVDTTIPGDYIITYSVIDTSGNTTTDSRVVTVLLPDLSINDVQITEGDVGTTDMIFTVSLDQAIGLDIMVDASTDDTASTAKLSDNDYVANAQSLTIPAGQTTAIFTVQVNNDIKVEQNETIVVRLSNAVNAALLDAQGQGTIINDDATTLSVSDATVTEGNSGNTDLIFQISLSAPSFQPITVEFRTEDITAQVSDSDYIPLGGSINTVTFPPNITMIPVTIPVKGDFKPEADETLRLLILNAVNASISDPEGIGTILNDDLLSLSISDAMVTEGNSGDTPQLEFVITLDQSSEADVSFDVRTIDGSALQSDSDYVADAGSTLIIPANQLNISYFVDITGDELVEADETLNVEISNPVNATISNSMANGTILNDDGVSIRVNDVAITEGDSANPQAIFTVSLSNPDTINIVEVDYQTSAVTAVAGNDFTPVSGRLSFPLNQTTQTIAVDILNDTLVESIETFTLDLSNELNATMADAQGVATITDNDKSVVSVNSASLAEGDVGVSGMNFTFTLDQVSVDDIVIDYNTQDNTATGADADFVATAGSAVITAGTLNTTVVIDVNGDVQVEADESFLLNLVNATNASIATLSTSGNIFNDDASLIMQKIVINDNTGAATVANFNVTTDAGVANFSSANTVGASTTYTSELIPVNAGTYSLTELEIPGYSEGLWSCDAGNLTANAFNAGSISLLNGDEAVCSITNNDEAIISIDSPSIVEGNTGTVDLVYTVSLDQASTVDVTVDADVSGGTATPGIDFTATQQTLSIPAGSTSTTYTVTVNSDNIVENDESIEVTLTTPVNALLGSATGSGLVSNDDFTSLNIDDVTLNESDAGTNFVFTVSLTQPADSNVTVDYLTADGTATTVDNDYVMASGSLTFTPGVVTQTITITVNGDTTVESDETFLIDLVNPAIATIADAQGQGTITNDDTTELVINDVTASETNTTTTFVFTVTLTEPADSNVIVDYSTTDGTATVADVDYDAAAGTLTFTPGMLSQSINIVVNGDTKVEDNETFSVNLSNPVIATLLDGSGTGTITNDDSSLLSITDTSQAELDTGSSIFNFTVSLNNPSALPVTVLYTTNDNTATVADSDYVATSGILTFASGETSKVIPVTVNGDVAVELDETFFIDLSAPTVAGILDGQGVGTITNDDASLIIRKVVINDNGNNLGAVDFGIATDAGALNFQPGVVTGSTTTYDADNLTVNAGSYTLSENDLQEYTEGTWACTVGTVTDNGFNTGSVTLSNGDEAICTISNDDIALQFNLSISNNSGLINDNDGDGKHSAGDSITYTYTIDNSGLVKLKNVEVTDLLIDPIGNPICFFSTITAANNASCDVEYFLTQADFDSTTNGGMITNNASSIAFAPDEASIVSETGPAGDNNVTTTFTQFKDFLITEVPDATVYFIGETITFDYSVENTGNLTISAGDLVISDILTSSSYACPQMAPGDVCTPAPLPTYVVDIVDVTVTSPTTAEVFNTYNAVHPDLARSLNTTRNVGFADPNDFDQDGLTNAEEANLRDVVDPVKYACLSETDPDSDNDGISDGVEVANNMLPCTAAAPGSVNPVLSADPFPGNITNEPQYGTSPDNPVTYLIEPGVFPGEINLGLTNSSSQCQYVNYVGSVSSSDSGQVAQLADDGRPTTILDMEGVRFSHLQDCDTIRISNMVLTNGVGFDSGGGSTRGGGIRISSGSILYLDNVWIENNLVTDQGGGIGVSNSGTILNAVNIVVRENDISGGKGGGGIWVGNGATMNIEDSRIYDNTSAGFGGGGIALDPGATALIKNNIIANNETLAGSSDGGGGILVLGIPTSATIINNVISGNESVIKGGGIALDNTSAGVNIHNNLIIGNYAPDGGGVYVDGDSALRNNTLAYNQSLNSGAAILVIAGSPIIRDSVFWENRTGNADLSSPTVAGDTFDTSTTPYAYSSFNLIGSPEGNVINNDQLLSDPLFDLAFYLGSGSPAINSGSVTSATAETETGVLFTQKTTDSTGTAVDAASGDGAQLNRGYHYQEGSVGIADQIIIQNPSDLKVLLSDPGPIRKISFIPASVGVRLGDGQDVQVSLSANSANIGFESTTSLQPLGIDSDFAANIGDGEYLITLRILPATTMGTFDLNFSVNGVLFVQTFTVE